MILGISTTKSAVIIAETKGAGDKFVITAIRPIPFQVRTGDDLVELLQSLIALFDRKGAGSVIALLKSSSGRFGSCLEAIKGEAMVELAAAQRGLRVVKVAPQSLKKTLGCAPDQKWRDRAGELFNPDGKHRNWSKGATGAVAVAFKVAGELPGLSNLQSCEAEVRLSMTLIMPVMLSLYCGSACNCFQTGAAENPCQCFLCSSMFSPQVM